MSGPVQRPLTTKTSDGSTTVRPTTTLSFNAGDFDISKTGSEATISLDSGGTGAALTATQVGFGNASNLMTGSSKLTWNDTAGSEQLKIIGSGVTDCGLLIENTNTGATSAPDLILERNVVGADNDFIGRMDFRGQNDGGSDVNYTIITTKIQDASEDAGRLSFLVNGNVSNNSDDSQLMIFGRTNLTGNPGLVSINNSARSDVDFRVSGDTNANLIRTDASLDAVGIGVAPPSGHAGVTVRMTVKGDNDDIALMLQNDGADDDMGPEMVLYRNSASPAVNDVLGRIRFDGEDSGGNVHTYFRMTSQIKDPTDASEDGNFFLTSRQDGSLHDVVKINGATFETNPNSSASVDVKFKGDNDTILFADSSQDNLGVGTASPGSDVERLHVAGTGTDTLVRLESSDAGATNAPDLELFRNSPSPADADYTGAILFSGYEDTGASSKVDYARIDTRMFGLDGSESGVLTLYSRQNNALRPQVSMKQVGTIINENHETVFDFVVESQESSAGFHNIYADSGQNNVGMGCVPDSGVERLHLKGTGTGSMLRLESTDTGSSSAPDLELYRNSSSPATDDFVGTINFTAETLTSSIKVTTGQILMRLKDISGDNINADFVFNGRSANASKQFLKLGHDISHFNGANADIDFRVDGSSDNLIHADAGQMNVAVGQSPSSTGAQFQVASGAQFYRETSNTFTANHDVTVEQAHGHVLVMDASSGSANTFTLPEIAAIGMHVKLVNIAGSNGMTVAVSGSSSHQINGAGSAGSSSVSTTTKFQTIECHYVATNVWVATEPAVAS